MLKPSRVLTGSCLAFVLAFAAPASSAVFPTFASLGVQIATLEPPTMSGSGSASSVGGPGTSHTLPTGLLSLATKVTIPVVPSFVAIGVISLPPGVTAPGGTFAPNGAMPVNGSALFFTSPATGAFTVGAVPLQPIGGGGTAMFNVGPLSGTLLGATWMGGGATPQVYSAMSVALAINITATATAYDNRTAAGRGIVQLVAPATGSLGVIGSLPVFGVLNIGYDVPEPAMTVLALVGGAVLVAAGRRKMRS